MPNRIKLLSKMIEYKGLMTYVNQAPVGITENSSRMPWNVLKALNICCQWQHAKEQSKQGR